MPCEKHIEKITKLAIADKSENLVLNVNFPSGIKEFKGIKICRQAKGYWQDKYDKRISPLGKEYYWLTGSFINQDEDKESDEWALKNGYITIVPISYDMTSYKDLELLNSPIQYTGKNEFRDWLKTGLKRSIDLSEKKNKNIYDHNLW